MLLCWHVFSTEPLRVRHDKDESSCRSRGRNFIANQSQEWTRWTQIYLHTVDEAAARRPNSFRARVADLSRVSSRRRKNWCFKFGKSERNLQGRVWRAQRGFPHSWNCHSVTNLTTFKLPFCCFQQNRLMERLEWKGEVTEEPVDSTEASEVISYGFIPSLINHRLPHPGCTIQPSVVNTLLLESNETVFQPTARRF